MTSHQPHRHSTSSPLLPSVFPNEDNPRTTSRTSSARASPALKDDLPLPPGLDSGGASAAPYISVTDDQLRPPRSFQPFFAIVEDAGTREVTHPSVHYVFSDDDPEVITAASLRSLGADEVATATLRRIDSEGQGLVTRAGDELPRDAALPPRRPGVVEQYVLMDMAADGQSVVSAKSLSADWAVTGTNLRNAPTFDASQAADDGVAPGLMLKVEGMDAAESASHGRREHEIRAEQMYEMKRKALGGDNVAAMGQLVEGLRRGMDTLGRVVVDAGDEVSKSQEGP
ncbi:hypothetical protein NA57DRAFT_52122 [Rhizodiscina lignyota]|uniref:Uncharacterized protein n=1 Tax=Rhizodiscina lignyota TaxID=1504668 RepID=A0A9P4INN2_9PEZI|nr:hypothetical protein NA57DRAFT_52122 [Rhizodiscina lignyota]